MIESVTAHQFGGTLEIDGHTRSRTVPGSQRNGAQQPDYLAVQPEIATGKSKFPEPELLGIKRVEHFARSVFQRGGRRIEMIGIFGVPQLGSKPVRCVTETAIPYSDRTGPEGFHSPAFF